MSRNLTTTQKAEIEKSQLKIRALLTINYNGGVLRILENDTLSSLTIAGTSYLAGMVYRANIETFLDGAGEKTSLQISNINKAVSDLISSNGDVFTNKICKIEEIIFNGDPAAWQVSTAYSGIYATPTVKNSYIYECTTAGTSGSSEPTWPTTIGNTVNDGTAVWTCRSPIIGDPILLFEGTINNIQLTPQAFIFDVERIQGGYEALSPNIAYDANCQYVFKDSRCGYAGAETACDKSLTRCQALSNVTKFGGFPSLVKQTVSK